MVAKGTEHISYQRSVLLAIYQQSTIVVAAWNVLEAQDAEGYLTVIAFIMAFNHNRQKISCCQSDCQMVIDTPQQVSSKPVQQMGADK